MNPPPNPNDTQERPVHRPSFQSPTKASLARSHPEILERAIGRSPTRIPTRIPRRPTSKGNQNDPPNQAGTRVFGLRDRKALRPSLTSTASPAGAHTQSKDVPSPFSSQQSSGLQAFAVPPRRVSRKITPADFMFHSPIATRRSPAENSHINTPEGQLASELDNAMEGVDANMDLDQPSMHEEFDEPELPPTPTQLGLEKLPGRSKGLLSSSPSSQRGKLARRRIITTREKSPSKLKSVEYGLEAEDTPASGLAIAQKLLPEPVLKRQKLKRELSAELQQLKKDVAALESWSENLDQYSQNTELAAGEFNELISLLTSEDPSRKPSTKHEADAPISSLISSLLPFASKVAPKTRQSPAPTNPFTLDQFAQTKPYLTVFAPLTLTAHSNTVSDPKPDILLERHNLTLSTPPPFPPQLYNIPIIYDVNPESQSLVSIRVPTSIETPNSKIPESLRQWINSRLSNPLLRLDISGLCWGINRYWEAAISRAQIWSKIEDRHAKLLSGRMSFSNTTGAIQVPRSRDEDLEGNAGTLTTSDLRRILPHIERTTMLYESTEKAYKILLSCNLTNDEWTSEPQLTPEISVSTTSRSNDTSSRKIEQEAKGLFHAILSENKDPKTRGGSGIDADIIIRATECVLGALFGFDTEGPAPKTGHQRKRK